MESSNAAPRGSAASVDTLTKEPPGQAKRKREEEKKRQEEEEAKRIKQETRKVEAAKRKEDQKRLDGLVKKLVALKVSKLLYSHVKPSELLTHRRRHEN